MASLGFRKESYRRGWQADGCAMEWVASITGGQCVLTLVHVDGLNWEVIKALTLQFQYVDVSLPLFPFPPVPLAARAQYPLVLRPRRY